MCVCVRVRVWKCVGETWLYVCLVCESNVVVRVTVYVSVCVYNYVCMCVYVRVCEVGDSDDEAVLINMFLSFLLRSFCTHITEYCCCCCVFNMLHVCLSATQHIPCACISDAVTWQ